MEGWKPPTERPQAQHSAVRCENRRKNLIKNNILVRTICKNPFFQPVSSYGILVELEDLARPGVEASSLTGMCC